MSNVLPSCGFWAAATVASTVVGVMAQRIVAPGVNGWPTRTPNHRPNCTWSVNAAHTVARGAFRSICFSIRSGVSSVIMQPLGCMILRNLLVACQPGLGALVDDGQVSLNGLLADHVRIGIPRLAREH